MKTEMPLEDREKRVKEILSQWLGLNLNDGWVSGFVLRELDAGGDKLDVVLARLRAKGCVIEETLFGRFRVAHYRLRTEPAEAS